MKHKDWLRTSKCLFMVYVKPDRLFILNIKIKPEGLASWFLYNDHSRCKTYLTEREKTKYYRTSLDSIHARREGLASSRCVFRKNARDINGKAFTKYKRTFGMLRLSNTFQTKPAAVIRNLQYIVVFVHEVKPTDVIVSII